MARVANLWKRGRECQDGNAYQLGGFSFDDKLLLLQILKREVLSACIELGRRVEGFRDGRQLTLKVSFMLATGQLLRCDSTG